MKHLEWHQGRIKELGVRVATELASELPPLAALALELEEVLRHVINNAFDAMSKGGGTLTVRTRAETDLVIVEIEDTGRGIPAAVRPHVFEPFYSTKEIGHGHGLSISQSIMLNLGGDIDIQSEERKGTRVTLKIPVISPAEGEPQAATGWSRSLQRQRRRLTGGFNSSYTPATLFPWWWRLLPRRAPLDTLPATSSGQAGQARA